MCLSQVPPYLSVIIPAYNEEARIISTLESIYTYLNQQAFSWEILVVLDGSQDNTLAVVENFAQDHHGICWIDRKENRGKGYTVREGMLTATGSIRLFTDADNSTDISHFDKMQPLFSAGHDVVICSRDSKDAAGARQAVPQSWPKRILGNLGNLFIQAVAVPGIWDTQCGFKAFTQEAAEQIFPVTRIDRWGFDTEVLALARHFNYSTNIVAAYWIDAEGTHIKFTDYFQTIWEPIKIRYNLITGVYERQNNFVKLGRKSYNDI